MPEAIELEGFRDSFASTLSGDEFAGIDDDTKARIIEAANGTAGGSAGRLINKNSELIRKNGNAKEVSHAEQERINGLQSYYDNGELEKAELQGKYEESKVLYQTSSDKKVAAVQEELEGTKGQLRILLVDNKLTSGLVKRNIHPDLMGDILVGMATKATVIDGKAMVGDHELEEYLDIWAETPAGKAACLAPNNSGGDANGGNNSPSNQSPDSNKPWKELSIQEKTARLELKGK